MAKIRVYELARELGQDNKSLEKVIRDLGISIKNYMSTLTPDEAERVRLKVSPGKTSSGPAKRSAKTVIRRRGAEVRRRRAEREQEAAAAEEAARAAEPAPPAAAPIRRAPAPTSRPAQRPAAVPGGGGVTTRPAARPASAPGAASPAASPASRPAPAATPGSSVAHQPAARAPEAARAEAPARAPQSTEPAPQRREVPAPSAPPVAAQRPPAPATSAPAAAQTRAPAPAATPSPAPRPVAGDNGTPARAAAAAPSRGEQPPPRAAEPPANGGAAHEDDENLPSPAVGTRIELPAGTRRLPGGMANRMTGDPGAPEAEAEISAGAAPAAPTPGAAAAGSPTPAAAAAPRGNTTTAVEGSGRRVVRNEDGVIVGAASQRSEPKIVGFIQLQQPRKRQQVIITDAAEEDRRGRASQRKQREERAQAQGRRRKANRGPRGRGGGGGPSKVSTVEMSEEKKRIRVDEAIQVSDLAHQLSQKASVVLRKLWGMGMRGITINNAIDFETAALVAAEFGYTAENVAFQETEITGESSVGEGESRAPVVTLMGHVDHGKTSLLDKLRATRVAAGEAGGITQHIGAYRVETKSGAVVFLDTPGHEAFTAMRSRGASVTDLVVLVVAADDGVMPTTVEAIKHAKDGNVPVVVAINKCDLPDANPGRVKQALMEQGIIGEEFGGDVSILEVSAKSGQGIPELLENLALQAEVLELRAPEEGRGTGTVLEARIDKGRGTVATVLVQSGQIKKGDIVVANEYTGKVRGLFDDRGKKLKAAGPSHPVEVLGLSGVPSAGDPIHVVESDRDAKALVSHRRELRKRKESVRSGPSIQELLARNKTPVLKVVLKADVQGSAQAVKDSLEALSTEKVKVEVLKAEVGMINETDVKYARAGESVIFGFNVKTTGKAAPVAEQEGVVIETFSVIYDATERCKEFMIGLLEPEYREREQGEAEVRALFPIPRLGVVAGCRVTRGLIQRTSHVRVVREGDVIHTGIIGSLRVFKDDVREVKDGFECGIVVDGFPAVEEGDTIQAFELEAIPPTL